MLDDVAFPVVPPVVEPVAELSPLLPDVTVDVEPSLALPVWPELAEPMAFPDLATEPTLFVSLGDCHAVDACAVPMESRSASATPAIPAAHRVLVVRLPITAVSFPIWTCRSGTSSEVLRAGAAPKGTIGASYWTHGRISREKSVYDDVVAVLIGNAVGLARGDDDRRRGSNNLLTSGTDTTQAEGVAPGISPSSQECRRGRPTGMGRPEARARTHGNLDRELR